MGTSRSFGTAAATVVAVISLVLLSACTSAVSVALPTASQPATSAPQVAATSAATPSAPPGAEDAAPSPEPAEGTLPDATAETTTTVSVSGFDAQQLWELCKAEGIRSAPTITDYAPFSPSDVTPATNGDGVIVQTHWKPPVEQTTPDMFWICGFNGDPASPTMWLFSSNLK